MRGHAAGLAMAEWMLCLEGVRLRGPLPITDVYVGLEPGLQAFYGLNGAGKTRVIRGVADVLSGRGDGYVIARGILEEGAHYPYLLTQLDRGSGSPDDEDWATRVLLEHGTSPGFDRVVGEHFSGKKQAEEKFLIDYCRAVLAQDRGDRFQLFGLEKRDIPEYLPASEFGLTKSWDELRAEFDAQTKIHSFKPWLRSRYEVEIGEENLEQAIAAMDSVPREFSALVDFVGGLRRRPLRVYEND